MCFPLMVELLPAPWGSRATYPSSEPENPKQRKGCFSIWLKVKDPMLAKYKKADSFLFLLEKRRSFEMKRIRIPHVEN